MTRIHRGVSILARYFAICLSGYLACLSGELHRSLVLSIRATSSKRNDCNEHSVSSGSGRLSLISNHTLPSAPPRPLRPLRARHQRENKIQQQAVLCNSDSASRNPLRNILNRGSRSVSYCLRFSALMYLYSISILTLYMGKSEAFAFNSNSNSKFNFNSFCYYFILI